MSEVAFIVLARAIHVMSGVTWAGTAFVLATVISQTPRAVAGRRRAPCRRALRHCTRTITPSADWLARIGVCAVRFKPSRSRSSLRA